MIVEIRSCEDCPAFFCMSTPSSYIIKCEKGYDRTGFDNSSASRDLGSYMGREKITPPKWCYFKRRKRVLKEKP